MLCVRPFGLISPSYLSAAEDFQGHWLSRSSIMAFHWGLGRLGTGKETLSLDYTWHLFHFIGIIIGIFVAVMFIGGLIPSGGGSATKGSSVKVKNVPKQTEASRDVWVVNGKEFASRGEASMYVKQFPYMDESWIRQERR